jgi:hypothetical protein
VRDVDRYGAANEQNDCVYVTGRDVPSGVLTDEDSFAHLPHEKVTVQCTACGDLHEYWTSEARLAQDANNKKPDTRS